jgi:hypothetical protein
MRGTRAAPHTVSVFRKSPPCPVALGAEVV